MPPALLADAISARAVMTGGVVVAAGATSIFGLTDHIRMRIASRVLEGLAAATVVPSLLAHITDVTARDHHQRTRAMTYFELSLLAGPRLRRCPAVTV